MIKGFIFDVDGVLTDTAKVSVELVTSFFKTKNIIIKNADVVKNLGKGMTRLFKDTADDLGLPLDVDEALEYSKAVYQELLQKQREMPGTKELLREAKKSGVKTAVASSATLWRVKANIASLGLTFDDFDVVLTGEDVVRNKPCPDIFSLAMIKLGLEGKESIVFEDSASGIRAGLASGAYCCALTTSISREEAKRLGASFVIDDLAHFPQFGSMDELQTAVKNLLNIKRGAKKYGANWITPLERTLSSSVMEKKAIEEAVKARYNAYAPYSAFKVGAAVVSAATGRIYSGCNVENSSYGATICAERNAITSAVAAEGVIGIDLLVVASASNPPAQPCAVCLQVMSEFILPSTPVILVNEDGMREDYVFSDLLPHPFDFGE